VVLTPLRRARALIAGVVGWLVLAGCAAHQAPREGPLLLGTRFTLDSKVLGGPREVNVWLPPDYEAGTGRYDVLYLLDGGAAQDFPHIAGLGQLGALSWTYQSLIIVGVATVDRQAELTPPAHSARFQRGFPPGWRRGALPRVPRARGAALRRGALPHRAVMGESLAGLFVVDTFLSAPGAFDDYVAVSPSLRWDEQRLAAEAPARLAQPTRRSGGCTSRSATRAAPCAPPSTRW